MEAASQPCPQPGNTPKLSPQEASPILDIAVVISFVCHAAVLHFFVQPPADTPKLFAPHST